MNFQFAIETTQLTTGRRKAVCEGSIASAKWSVFRHQHGCGTAFRCCSNERNTNKDSLFLVGLDLEYTPIYILSFTAVIPRTSSVNKLAVRNRTQSDQRAAKQSHGVYVVYCHSEHAHEASTNWRWWWWWSFAMAKRPEFAVAKYERESSRCDWTLDTTLI